MEHWTFTRGKPHTLERMRFLMVWLVLTLAVCPLAPALNGESVLEEIEKVTEETLETTPVRVSRAPRVAPQRGVTHPPARPPRAVDVPLAPSPAPHRSHPLLT